MKLFEKGPGFQSGLADLPKHLNGSTISAGLISTVFGCTGPCLVTVAAANAAGFTLADTVTWVFGIYVFGGLLGTILALYYKIPVSGAYSIPGATLMGTALAGYSFNEAAGAFIIAGVIVLIIGLSGAIGKIMQFLPLEIVMAMVGGAMMKFGSGIVTTTQGNPVVCGAAVLAFFLVPRIIRKCPAVVAALIAGFAAALLWRGFDWRRTLAAGLCATGLIESWQLCVGRAFDIDDILLNTLGVFCGYGLWRLTRRLDPGFAEKFHVRMSEESADECDD